MTLEARGIGRRDPKGSQWLLRDVDLAIEPGDRLAVVGPSGAGKTVLMRALAALDPLDEGQVLWDGRPVRGETIPTFRTQVVYLHQRPAMLEGSVEANLRRPFALKANRGGRYDRRRIEQMLGELGRDGSFLNKPHHDLSGGEGQVVALLRALQLDPAVLLLDEATASLDRPTARSAEALLDRWYADGAGTRAIAWVTHDPDQASRVGRRHVALDAGRCVAVEEPRS